MNKQERVAAIAKHVDSTCGLDRNIHGVFTLGCYDAPPAGRKVGDYLQLTSSTAAGIRKLAKTLGFKTVIDRISDSH